MRLSTKTVSVGFLAMAALVATAGTAQAAITSYGAALSGANEVPPVITNGTGVVFVDVDDVALTMHVHVEFSGLTGNTTASHIHASTAAAFTGNAGVATTTPTFAGFPLGVTAGTYDITLDMTLASSYNPAFVTANGGTTASAFAALNAGIAAGKSYLNVHSSFAGGGEIRGYLRVPAPSAAALLGLGGLAMARRRR